jgi:N-acetylmuramidase
MSDIVSQFQTPSSVVVATASAIEFSGPGGVLTPADYKRAATAIGCEIAAVMAVATQESSGHPFLGDGTGRPTILFESHTFSEQTNGIHDGSVDTQGVAISTKTWVRNYGATGAHQYDRLACAIKLDREAALSSASWGGFQVMGFNHASCGFSDVESYVAAMCSGADAQLEAFISFCKKTHLDRFLIRKDWVGFALGYNGSGEKSQGYDTK